jgi:hypothetical protein
LPPGVGAPAVLGLDPGVSAPGDLGDLRLELRAGIDLLLEVGLPRRRLHGAEGAGERLVFDLGDPGEAQIDGIEQIHVSREHGIAGLVEVRKARGLDLHWGFPCEASLPSPCA